ncbi:hypothetical protein KPB2_5555 [Klebsiella pneumoniae Kb677]|nr:hypothetical protein KPB2_5555 [Klebsiella pneumoniae Kb677]
MFGMDACTRRPPFKNVCPSLGLPIAVVRLSIGLDSRPPLRLNTGLMGRYLTVGLLGLVTSRRLTEPPTTRRPLGDLTSYAAASLPRPIDVLTAVTFGLGETRLQGVTTLVDRC